ncbi:MAG: 4-hydroxy-tetrahydrodipicolinate synthase [Rectinemataceae bacterium]|jgi:4-hydroxy-tetrahydrodipicolinate synthase
MDIQRLKGLGVALATPFHPAAAGAGRDAAYGAGGVDMPAFRALVSRLVNAGTDFLVVLGSTGEAVTVTESERDALVAAALEEARGIPVIVGAGHNSTAQAVALAARSARSGADGLLVVTPYYNKPQPAGLEAHYRAVAAAAAGLPIIVYNVPGRTGLNLLPKDLGRLWAIPQVIAVKESSGSLAQIGEILRTMPEGKLLFSGDDALALPAIALGGAGLISVIGNILPAETKALVDAALAGRREEARRLHARLLPMMDALFLESNPAPLKAALALAGYSSDAVRLPLAPASEATRARLAELLPAFGLGTMPKG